MRWREISPELTNEIKRLKSLKPRELLSVNIDATSDEIKSAYRRLAKVYHPDKADPFMRKHNEEVMKLINAAYEQLNKESHGGK